MKKLTTKTCKKERVEENFSGYMLMKKSARVQFKARQGNSGHDKFWTCQIQAKTGVQLCLP